MDAKLIGDMVEAMSSASCAFAGSSDNGQNDIGGFECVPAKGRVP
jgi:hypothetical protein